LVTPARISKLWGKYGPAVTWYSHIF